MKKWICRFVMLIFMILLVKPQDVYGASCDVTSEKMVLTRGIAESVNALKENLLENLKNDYNYEGELVNPIYIDTSIKIVEEFAPGEAKDGSGLLGLGKNDETCYSVSIGSLTLGDKSTGRPDVNKSNYFTAKELKDLFALEKEPKEGDTWEVYIEAAVTDGSDAENNGQGTGTQYSKTITISKIWSGKEREEQIEKTKNQTEVDLSNNRNARTEVQVVARVLVEIYFRQLWTG